MRHWYGALSKSNLSVIWQAECYFSIMMLPKGVFDACVMYMHNNGDNDVGAKVLATVSHGFVYLQLNY